MNGVVAPYRATVVTLAAHRKNRPKDVQVLRPASTNNRCGDGGVGMRLFGRWGRGNSRRRASAEQPVCSGCSVSFP